MDLRAGDFVTDAVRLVRPLAEGGMGRVWVAEHLGLHTQVVVKLMASEMMARDDGASRFAREAAVAAAIKSPHVVQIFDHGITKAPTSPVPGVPYIVMELLEGKDLGAVLEDRGRLEPSEAAQVIVQVGKALAKAHKAGIVHRDIKPENIFLCAPENDDALSDDASGNDALLTVKLLDFGTAMESRAGSGPKMTMPGEIMGTPYYMSPEQAIGATVDARTDMWSLGIVAFEMLTGVKPFEGSNVGAIALAIHGGLPMISTRVSDLPLALDAWFSKACAQLPHERYATMRELTADFVEALTGTVTSGDSTEAIVLPRRISVRPSSPPGSSPSDEMRKTLQTSIEPSLPPPAHPHPAFSETASFGSNGLFGANALKPGSDEAVALGDVAAAAGSLFSGNPPPLPFSDDVATNVIMPVGAASDGAVEVPMRDSVRERVKSGPTMMDSIAPLASTLPDRKAGQRPTKIAASVVGALALAMMAGIVMHRPSAPAAPAAAAVAPPPAPVKTSEPPPAAEPIPPPEPVAEPVHAHAKAKKAATTKPHASAAAVVPTSAAPAAPGKKSASKQEDEDLAKLIKAGTDTPAPAATPLTAVPAAPSAPSPKKADPAPAATPLPAAPPLPANP